MKIRAYIERERRDRVVEVKEKSSVADVLEALGINPVTVIVTKNNEMVTENHVLQGNDKVKVISVVSGG